MWFAHLRYFALVGNPTPDLGFKHLHIDMVWIIPQILFRWGFYSTFWSNQLIIWMNHMMHLLCLTSFQANLPGEALFHLKLYINLLYTVQKVGVQVLVFIKSDFGWKDLDIFGCKVCAVMQLVTSFLLQHYLQFHPNFSSRLQHNQISRGWLASR